jgi:hypothetical protein
MFIELCFNFYVCFCIPLTLIWSVVFLYLASCLNYVILSQVGLLEVHVTCRGPLVIFRSGVMCCQMVAQRNGFC